MRSEKSTREIWPPVVLTAEQAAHAMSLRPQTLRAQRCQSGTGSSITPRGCRWRGRYYFFVSEVRECLRLRFGSEPPIFDEHAESADEWTHQCRAWVRGIKAQRKGPA